MSFSRKSIAKTGVEETHTETLTDSMRKYIKSYKPDMVGAFERLLFIQGCNVEDKRHEIRFIFPTNTLLECFRELNNDGLDYLTSILPKDRLEDALINYSFVDWGSAPACNVAKQEYRSMYDCNYIKQSCDCNCHSCTLVKKYGEKK